MLLVRQHAWIIINDDVPSRPVALQMTIDLGASDRNVSNLFLREKIWRPPIYEITILTNPGLSQLIPAVGVAAPGACDNQTRTCLVEDIDNHSGGPRRYVAGAAEFR
nr:hypothetical protein [Microvirga sp. HBU65207]